MNGRESSPWGRAGAASSPAPRPDLMAAIGIDMKDYAMNSIAKSR